MERNGPLSSQENKMTKLLEETTMPIVVLKNGTRVGNFSSPHEFRFDDGSVLPACPPERVQAGALEVQEATVRHPKGWTDIKLNWTLSDSCCRLISESAALFAQDHVDVVLVPLPVMTVIKRDLHVVSRDIASWPFRVVRVADRTSKVIHADRFCI